ncbi:MAG: PA14 domain-containing protein [Phycisphaerales bacterium]
MHSIKTTLMAAGLASLAVFGATRPQTDVARCEPVIPVALPEPMSPNGQPERSAPTKRPEAPIARLAQPGDVAWGSTPGEAVSTLTMVQSSTLPFVGEPRLVRNMLPEHVKPSPAPAGAPNGLVAGTTLDEPRTIPESMFPTIGATGWNPPDPTLAVGPNHAVVTVNATIAFYNKTTGSETFRSSLSNAGGFFGALGAGGFVFDPKVVYDHIAQRFVVVALEVYDPNQAWIDIAVSDDSDPNGVWYKYRTDVVLDIGGSTVWWDFPGIGYDAGAYYVTGNLFGLNGGPYGGVGFRVFNKTPLLTGATAVYSTLREPGLYTCMPALHFGTNSAAYFANIANSTTTRLYAIRNPLTTPTLVNTSITTPGYTGAVGAPTINGTEVSNAGITMPYFRNGRLWLVHNASVSGRNVARWHEFNVNSWPTSGAVTRVQSGDIDAGPGLHTIFPAIGVNSAGDAGVSLGVTSATSRVAVAIAGRRAADPLGRMGVPVVVKQGESDGGGRWGDYYAVAVDPNDDTTFWGVGEYRGPSGWQNWVSSFTVASQSLCHPIADDIGAVEIGVTAPVAADVLANDWHSTGQTMTIDSFSATSTQGGVVTRSIGTGPGGRDRLIYTPPTGGNGGNDSFSYTVRDPAGNTASASVVVLVYNPASYRVAENPAVTRLGLQVAWYDVTGDPANLPDFGTLTPYQYNLISNINVAATAGNFSVSGRADDFGAVYEGYINITAAGLYTFYTNSDDGSKLYLGDALIVNNDGLHGAIEVASARIGLQPGKHRIRLEYYDAGGTAQLSASFAGPGITKQVLPSTRLFSTRPCPSNFQVAPDPANRQALLAWTPGVGFDPAGVVVKRDGVTIASLSATASSFADTPNLPTDPRHARFEYSIEPAGPNAPACVLAPASVLLSSGSVRFAENFDGFANTGALTAAGWQSVLSGAVNEAGAAWALDGGRAANPPGFDGNPTSGRYVISDSDLSTGTNATGGGASLDLISPTIDCTGLTRVMVHFDAVAQLNNNGSAIFDVDVRTAANPTWTNVLRRVAPSRTSPAPAVTVSNADGVFGRVSLDITARAANAAGVQLRFRHFEPTDDWFVALDNVLVDDVNAPAGGGTTVLGPQSFLSPIAPPWLVVSPLTGSQTWTIADPCRRSVTNNGGVFPRNGGQAINRLGGAFALCDSSCNPTLAHNDLLVTPTTDCSRAARVYLHFRSETVISTGTMMEVLVSLDGGSTFLPKPVFVYNPNSLHDPEEEPFYDVRTRPVPAAAGASQVAFAFRYANNGAGLFWGIDDVKVSVDLACLSDFNSDGSVDGDDVIAFFASWDIGSGDVNHDGSTDGDDVIVFFAAWDAGC